MKSLALIAEYNPFHNGHAYQIQEAKNLFPDYQIIIILNGNFLQRGEPALVNKFVRTKWALKAGADIVCELPFAFGTQRADVFAKGAVGIAQQMGATKIVYGIEAASASNDLHAMLPNQKLAHFYEIEIKKYPSLSGVPIKRIHSNYNDTTATHEHIASATTVRNLYKMQDKTLTQYLPEFVCESMSDQHIHKTFLDDYFPVLQTKLITTDATLPALMQHGMYQSVISALKTKTSFPSFFETIHHKHMSRTHTSRALTYMLTATTQAQLDDGLSTIWTRILGLSASGKLYLRHLKKLQENHSQIIRKPSELQYPHDVLQYNSMIAYALISHSGLKESILEEAQSKPIFFDGDTIF